jgi:hypothetical protein
MIYIDIPNKLLKRFGRLKKLSYIVFNKETKTKTMEEITQKEFEKLPMNEQMFRWALFIASEGYSKKLSNRLVKELADKHKVKI